MRRGQRASIVLAAAVGQYFLAPQIVGSDDARTLISAVAPAAAEAILVPELVVGLRHTFCKTGVTVVYGCQPPLSSCPKGNTDGRLTDPSVTGNEWLDYKCNPDYGAEKGIGFSFNLVKESLSMHPDLRHMPPGLTLALSHNRGQMTPVLGVVPSLSGNAQLMRSEFAKRGLKYMTAFDVVDMDGGSVDEAEQVSWFETTGEAFTDWSLFEQLPQYTVLGLRHTVSHQNHPDRYFTLGGTVYDPLCPQCPVPPGFMRVDGGDRGAPAGVGFVWYEKVSGPSLYVREAFGSPGQQMGTAPPPPPPPPTPPPPPPPLPVPGPVAMLHGCIADNPNADPSGTWGRDLDGAVMNSPAMTVNVCTSFCKDSGFRFAGLQFGSWCFCGHAFGRYPGPASCTMPCSGAPAATCGGVWANEVWEIVE